MMSEKVKKNEAPTARNRVALGVLATLFLGAIGSGIWEVLFRPGLSHLGDLMSSASSRFESLVYATAALDPQPLPGLLLLLVLCAAPLMVAIWFGMEAFVRLPLRRAVEAHVENSIRGVTAKTEVTKILTKKRWAIGLIAIVTMCIFGSVSLVGFTLQNEATKIWRIFQSNLEITAAVTPEQDIRILRAKFRQMKTRNDFVLLKQEMDSMTVRGSVRLNWYGT